MDKSLRKKYEISKKDLMADYDSDEFNFKTTGDLDVSEGLETIIGQEKALHNLEKGLKIKSKHHHIFVTGPEDEEREKIILSQVENYIKNLSKEEISKKQSKRKDIISAYNFNDPENPVILELPLYQGEQFKKQLENVVDTVLKDGIKEYGKTFTEKSVMFSIDAQKQEESFQQQKQQIDKKGRALKTEMGKHSSKLRKDNLSEGERDEHTEEYAKIEDQLRQLRQEYVKLEEDYKKEDSVQQVKFDKEMDNIQDVYKELKITPEIKKVKEKYSTGKKDNIQEYLDQVEESMEKDSQELMLQLEMTLTQKPDPLAGMGIQLAPVGIDLSRYEMKVLNRLKAEEQIEGIPVIFEKKPTLESLFGTIPIPQQYQNQQYGTVTKKSPHLEVKAGSLVKSMGGYLIIETMSATQNNALINLIENLNMGETKIENIAYKHFTNQSTQEFDCSNIKVIISGDNSLYQKIKEHSNEGIIKFNTVFGHKVELDPTAKNTRQTREQYAKRIAKLCKEEGLKDLTTDGLAEILKYSARLTDNKDKLIAINLLPIENLVREANLEAEGSDYITAKHVKEVDKENKERHSLIKEKMQENMQNGKRIIDTKGEIIGQINALGVLQTTDLMAGAPIRLTVSSSKGNQGAISLDNIAGNTDEDFKKSMIIVSANLNELFAQDEIISLSAGISFEQTKGVGGASAGLATYLALMSKLSDYPIDQGIAVTGALDQKGLVNYIGGVNEKIEGFYHACKTQGLTGSQGVIIPKTNVDNLVLSDEVMDSIGKDFHIYPVSNKEEAIEIITGKKACSYDKKRKPKFSKGTVYEKVNAKIKELNKSKLNK